MQTATTILSLDPLTWELRTERLIFRAPQPGDGATVNAAVAESLCELQPWMPWAQTLPTVEESEAVGVKAHQEFADGEDYMMRLWLHDETFVGGSGLHRGNPSVPSFETGYWCRTSLAGRGYITEAVQALSVYAFSILGVQRLEIRCDRRNMGSRRVAKKCGFQLEGVLRNEARGALGELRDTCIYARFPDAFPD